MHTHTHTHCKHGCPAECLRTGCAPAPHAIASSSSSPATAPPAPAAAAPSAAPAPAPTLPAPPRTGAPVAALRFLRPAAGRSSKNGCAMACLAVHRLAGSNCSMDCSNSTHSKSTTWCYGLRTPYVQHARHAPSTIPHHPVAASAQDQPATRAQGTCAVSCSEVGAQPSRRHAIAIRVSAVSGMKLPTATLHPPSSVASRPCRDTAHPWACPAYGRCCLIDQCPMFPGTAACRSPSLQVFNTVVTNTTQHNTPGQHGRAWTHRQKYTPRSTDLPVLSSSCRYQGDHMVRE